VPFISLPSSHFKTSCPSSKTSCPPHVSHDRWFWLINLNVFSRIPSLHLMRSMSPCLTTSQMPRRSGPACSLAAEGPAEAPPTAASEENGAVDPSTLETSPQVKNNVGDKTQGEMRQLKGQEAARAGVRPFLCDTCGKGFTLKRALAQHQVVHTQEKPFVCPACGIAFGLKSNLRRHLRVHTGEKPFRCEECGGEFSGAWALKTHKLHHGAQKPFTCPLCEKTFYFKSKLREHQAAAHRDQIGFLTMIIRPKTVKFL
uniref:C2H2-type domain-containing protein n=1 Tax=Mola mola TaxID=94237 RepID=A0A3Q3WK71_MOLML